MSARADELLVCDVQKGGRPSPSRAQVGADRRTQIGRGEMLVLHVQLSPLDGAILSVSVCPSVVSLCCCSLTLQFFASFSDWRP